MYFPYLRGRRTELLALRDFLKMEDAKRKEVWPVIEPVKEDLTSLCRVAKEMIDNGQKFILVLNPYQGDFSGSKKDILPLLDVDIREAVGKAWIPSYVYLEGLNFFTTDSFQEKSVLVFPENVEFTDVVKGLVYKNSLIGILDGTENNQRLSRIVRSIGQNQKLVARLSNNFNEQRRNVDYLGKEDEFFSDDFLDYEQNGYQGVADYTTLPKSYTEGGMLPYAVAIHLTYRSDESIRIHHFVSDSNLDQSGIQTKFAEAAEKVKAFFSQRPKTQGVRMLLNYLETDRYPGLAALKRCAILNHIEIMMEAQHRESA